MLQEVYSNNLFVCECVCVCGRVPMYACVHGCVFCFNADTQSTIQLAKDSSFLQIPINGMYLYYIPVYAYVHRCALSLLYVLWCSY